MSTWIWIFIVVMVIAWFLEGVSSIEGELRRDSKRWKMQNRKKQKMENSND